MKIKLLKRGTLCTDRATKLDGIITHWICDMSYNINYIFHPKGLNESGQPLINMRLELARLNFTPEMFEEEDVPVEILGTNVTDTISGFSGMAVGLVKHLNGCLHCTIQPKTIPGKPPVEINDFDLRQCKGPKIPKLPTKDLEESKKKSPSPTGKIPRVRIPKV